LHASYDGIIRIRFLSFSQPQILLQHPSVKTVKAGGLGYDGLTLTKNKTYVNIKM
jgi:hypothetical protein